MIESNFKITLEKKNSNAYKKYYNTYFNEIFSLENQDWNNLILGSKYLDIPNYQKKICLYNHKNKLHILTKSDVLTQGIDQIVATNIDDTITDILKNRIYDKKTMFFLKLKYKYDKICEKSNSVLLNNLNINIVNSHTNFRDIHYYFTSYGYIQNNTIYNKLQTIVIKELRNINTDINKLVNNYSILRDNKTYAKVFEYMLHYNYKLIPIEEYIYFNEDNFKDIHKEQDFFTDYNSNVDIVNKINKSVNQKISMHYTDGHYKKKRNRNLITKMLNLLVSKRIIPKEQQLTIKNYKKSDNQIFFWYSDILNHALIVYRGTFRLTKSENVHSDIVMLTKHNNQSIRIQNNRHLYLNHIKYYIEHLKILDKELLNDKNLIVTFAGHSLGGNIAKDINKTIIENKDLSKPYLVITYNHFSTENVKSKQDNEFDISTDVDFASLSAASVPQDPNTILIKHNFRLLKAHSILSIGKYLYKDTTPNIFVNETNINEFLNKLTNKLSHKTNIIHELSDDIIRKTVIKVMKNEPCIKNLEENCSINNNSRTTTNIRSNRTRKSTTRNTSKSNK